MNDIAQPRPLGLLVIAAITATVNVMLAARMPSGMESFRDMFSAFGITPPPPAEFFVRHPNLWWILGVAGLALLVWIAARSMPSASELRRMKISLRVLIAITALTYGIAAWAIYTPLFKLGAPV